MKLSLYEIEKSQMELAQALIENGGELTPEMEEALKITSDQLQNKGVCYGFIVKELESDCDIIDKELERLKGLKKSREKAIERLKNNLSTAMQVFEIEKIETPLIKISFRKSESVEIDNMAQLDPIYIVVKTTVTPDKDAIKKAIKSGKEFEGARLIENKNLQIK